MKYLFAVVMFLFVMVIGEGSSLPALVTGSGTGAADELRSSVLSLDKVIRNTMKTINQNPGTTLLTPEETRELIEFSLYLQTRVVFYCEQLASQFPVQAMADLPCPSPNSAAGSGLILPPRAATGKEEIGNLEQQLTESMGAFDEMLLTEETRIASHRSTSSGSVLGGSGRQGQMQNGVQVEKDAVKGDGSKAGRENQGRDAGGQDKVAAGAGQSSDKGGTPSTSSNDPSGKLAIDDDIVARQLREAAEKEQDPELKEKLWQEYWKYKGKRM